jgi:hypothetical protein
LKISVHTGTLLGRFDLGLREYPSQSKLDSSCQIFVYTLIVLVAFEILTRDKTLNSVLDNFGIWFEKLHELLRNFHNKILVAHSFPGLPISEK